jgi:hypothetical protein
MEKIRDNIKLLDIWPCAGNVLSVSKSQVKESS